MPTNETKSISLVLVPGPGLQHETVALGSTLAQFAADKGLNGRQLIVDGENVAPGDWSNVTLDEASEVFAVTSLKGN